MNEAANPSGAQQHWDRVFSSKSPDEVSWFRPHLEMSLEFIRRAATKLSAPILDVGGGESTLVDDLLDAGYTNLTLLDISQQALDHTRDRLGNAAARVTFLSADILTAQLPPHDFRVWHDRAVFHFLISPDDRTHYVQQAISALRHGGHVILATFAPNGPTHCSGLPVQRHDAASILREFGPQFTLVHTSNELHTTPSGATQPFVYCDLLFT